MALRTLGTNATTSLNAILFSGAPAQADVASLTAGIFDDQIVTHPVYPGAFSTQGLLYVPNRGVLKVLPGDFVAIDSTTGWPILLSAYAAASGPYTHT